MSISGIQGQLLEVTVVGCNKLKNTEFISKQDPYVCVEYGGNKFRTRTCTDGGKNPTFQEKFLVTLIEGLREISVAVWNSNTISSDAFIGNGKIQLQKVLSHGYDDCPWTLQDKRGKYSGEVRLIMHYANAMANANKPGKPLAPSAPPVPQYAGTPPTPSATPYPPMGHPPPPPPQPQQHIYPSYTPNAGHPPPPYHQPAAYHPHYPTTSSYPPQPQPAYPPVPHVDPYRYPPGPYAPHTYPPPY